MAVKRRKTKSAGRVKKKKWFAIHSPKLFNEISLGESYVVDAEDLNGKYITANLSTITRNMRKQNANVQFKVVKVEDGKGKTEVIGYSMINAAIKRLVRRGRDKVADSFLVKTLDKKVMRIKPLIITSTHTTKAIQSSVRLDARRVVREYAVTKSVEGIIDDIVQGKLQKLIGETGRKIFPLKTIEIRIAKYDEFSKVVVTDKEVTSEPVKHRKGADSEEVGQKWKENMTEETAENAETTEDAETTDDVETTEEVEATDDVETTEEVEATEEVKATEEAKAE